MRIVISGMFWSQPTVGSGQYLHGLLRGLLKVAPQHDYRLILPSYIDIRNAPSFPASIRVQFVRTPFDWRNTNLAKLWYEQIGVPWIAYKVHADILHIPYAAPPLWSVTPAVTTIHDIIWHLLPEYRGRRLVRAYMSLIPIAARRAAYILASSEHARRDIVKHFGCTPDHVTASLLAADPQYRQIDPIYARNYVFDRYGLQEPFIYYVGGFDVRKNVITLVRAFGRMRRAGGPEATLVLAGSALGKDPVLFPDIDSVIATQRLGNQIRRIDVRREDNPFLYAAATVFAYPSRYEGFGLPPLEAMACGAPVITTDVSSLPEVVDGAALQITPDDETEWTAALWRILVDVGLRNRLREASIERAQRFSYERVAHEAIDVFERIAKR